MVSQKATGGDNAILVQAGRDVFIGIQSQPPNIKLVRIQIDDDDDDAGLRQKINVTLKNSGGETAVLLEGILETLSSAELTNCNLVNVRFRLISSDWTYDLDIDQPQSAFTGKHSIAPNEVVNFDILVARKRGGPDITVYKCRLNFAFDSGPSLTTDSFYLKISGPTTIAGAFNPGTSEEEWGSCWVSNIQRLDAIGYDARPLVHPDSAHVIEKQAPGIMTKDEE